MSAPLLEAREIETSYGPVRALRGVSLDVAEGEIVAVLGANGAGKTTLLKTISGIAAPHRGDVRLEGAPVTGLEPDRIVAGGVVHVPEGREMFPLLSVHDNLAMGAWTRTDGTDAVARDRRAVCELFPVLKHRLRQSAGTLSGGEQQMLAIARALMARPRIMLLDEPSLGLSPKLVAEIFTIVARLRDERGVAILLVEQNADAALAIADRGYVLQTGQVAMQGPARTLRESPKVRTLYLGMDDTGQHTGQGRPGKADTADAGVERLRESTRGHLIGTAAAWTQLQERTEASAGRAGPIGRWAFTRALACGAAHAHARSQRRRITMGLRMRHALWDRLVLARVRRRMGLGKTRQASSTTGPMGPELRQWYQAIGIAIREQERRS